MKKAVLMLITAGLFAAMPVLAVEKEKGDLTGKTCIQRCVVQSETIDQKIKRLQSELAEGKRTYSAEELKKIELKLNEANYMLDALAGP